MGPPAPFRTPQVDEYAYRLVSLDNGIQALLVHDPETDKAAAACDVRVGSLSDPDDLPGLAHFTEHMLFYSSEKYPEEDAYSKFIAEHGGHTNAYTANESTNYHFDTNWDALPEALDRFAQFFVSPLISADGVDREVNAVDSEHAKNTNSDPWKKLQLWKATANPEHPFARFATGNLDTLMARPTAKDISVHSRVKQFHSDHYSAGLMRVVVLGRHSLDELEAMVREKFDPVEDRRLIPAVFKDDAVTEAQAGTLIRMVPERDGHSIEIQWPTLSEQAHYASAPSHYVSFLLGHEGEGSAFALLKARGWATSLSAGEGSTSYSSRSFFMCRIELTEEGQRRVADVVGVIFAYLALLRGPDGVQEWVWREMEALARLRFEFRDKLNPYSYVSSLSHGMQVYRPEDLLEAMYNVPLQYNPDLIAAVVADLNPDNARIMWASKALVDECPLREEWYGTPYNSEPIPQEWAAAWRSAYENGAVVDQDGDEERSDADAVHVCSLHLPAANEFVPSDFTLLDNGEETPVSVHNDAFSSLWFRPDPTFKVPKAVLYIHLRLPEAYASPYAAVLTQLYVRLVNDALSEVTYPADVAGLGYGLRTSVPGILMSFSGYHHTLGKLAETVVQAVAGCEVRPDRFKLAAEKLAKDYANMKFEQPYQLAMYDLALAMEAKRWHVSDYEAILPGLTPQDLVNFLPRLLGRCHIEAFSAGNLSEKAAKDLVDATTVALKQHRQCEPPFGSQGADARVIKLRPGNPVMLTRPGSNPANDNSAIAVAFQVGPDAPRTNALAELLAHVGKRDAFYQLRTVEQLGYLTFFSTYWTLTVCTVAFIIQSSAKDAVYLESRVEAFLPKLQDRLASMTEEEFAVQVEELAKAKLERPKRLREVAAHNWKEIDDGTLRFAREEEEVEMLRSLTPADLLAFFEETVASSATRRKISVHIEAAAAAAAVAAGRGEEGGLEVASMQVGESAPASSNGAGKGAGEELSNKVSVIEDVFAWKRHQELYPSFR